MDLRMWLFLRRVTQKQLAQELELHPGTISFYINKKGRLSKKVARHIERVTNGEVTAEEVILGNPERAERYGVEKNV